MWSEVRCDYCPFNGTETASSLPGCWAVQLLSILYVKALKFICVTKYCLFSCLSLNYEATVPKCKFEECSGAERDTNLNMCNKGKEVEANRKSVSFQSKKRACFSQWCTERSGPLQRWIEQGKRRQMIASCCEDMVRNVKSVLPGNTSVWFKWCPSLLQKSLVILWLSVAVWHLLSICQLRDSGCWLVFGSRLNESTWWSH